MCEERGMFQSLRRAMLLPRLRALRGVDVSFRDWLLDAAAQRGRLVRWTACGVVGMLAACGWLIGLAIVEVTEWFEYSFSKIEIQDHISGDQWNDSNLAWGVAGLLLVLVPVVICPLLARRAARRVLMRRHECPRCRHDVRGTPVASANEGAGTLACTECGYAVRARVAWNEVASVGDRSTFQPATDLIKPLLSRRATRVLIACGATLLALGVLIPAGYWGLREYRIRKWARHAAAAPSYVDQIDSLIAQSFSRNPPDIDPDQPTFWTELLMLRRDIEDAQRIARDRDKPADESLASRFFPDVSQVAESIPESASEADRDLLLAEQRSARRIYDDLAKTDVIARIDGLGSLSLRPVPSARDVGVDAAAKFGAARSVIRLNRARAAVSLSQGEPDGAARAWRASLQVSHRIASYPTFLAKLVSLATYGATYSAIRMSSRELQNQARLDECVRMIRETDAAESLESTLWIERASIKESVAKFFMSEGPRDPDATIVPISIFGSVEGRIGSFAANIEAIDAFYDDLARYAESPSWPTASGEALRGGQFKSSADAGLMIVELLNSSGGFVDQWSIMRPLERDGTLVMLAIERHRMRVGRLPSTLDELVPIDIAELPLDPWSGKPFVYRPLSEQEVNDNPKGWPYVLYSVGPDRVDNGGEAWTQGNPLATTAPKGTDNVITTLPK